MEIATASNSLFVTDANIGTLDHAGSKPIAKFSHTSYEYRNSTYDVVWSKQRRVSVWTQVQYWKPSSQWRPSNFILEKNGKKPYGSFTNFPCFFFLGNKVDFVPGVIISKELQPREELKKKVHYLGGNAYTRWFRMASLLCLRKSEKG